MIQINLLPDLKKDHIKAVRQKKMIISTSVIVSLVFLGIVILLSLTVFVVQKTHISDLTNDINEDIASLQAVEDLDKVLTIQNQLSVLPSLDEQKPNVNNLFKYLSRITPENVRLVSNKVAFSTASTDASTTTSETGATGMEITGNTATFKDANRFVDILKNATYTMKDSGSGEEVSGNAFESVILESITKNTSDTDASRATLFTINVAYNPDIFNKKYDVVTLKVPTITSSVSSTEKPKLNNQPFDNKAPEE